ncbi:MAG: B12-binding domain-containing radical SAM protein, partial [Phycisphaerae bacterium]|nr:B12-binding domain-containing radical SAM protein [Phycisphaerae bacterium]
MEIRSKNHLVPSETLTALAAVTPRRHKVEIADENVTPIRLDDRPDLVAITVYTFLAPRAYEIADAYRARGIPVVLGGLHITG